MDILSKDNSLILRGLCITSVILHNFLTFPQFGLSRCNEMSFSVEKTWAFLNSLGHGNMIAEFITFIGWVAMPVFVFLTGYGVTISSSSSHLEPIEYIKKQWLKLVLLLTPMLIVFGMQDIIQHDYATFVKRLFYPTLLVNFAYPYLRAVPGTYWYFSLTFQFYLIWAIWGERLNKKNLLWLSLFFIVGLWLLCRANIPSFLSIYKHCFTGWFFMFAFGVYMAKYKNNWFSRIVTTWWQEILLMISLLALVIAMNLYLESWLFVPFFALFLIIFMGRLVLRFKYISKAISFIGRYSACIFVCHPLMKSVVSKIGFRYTDNMLLLVLSYVILTIALSILYARLYNYLRTKFV